MNIYVLIARGQWARSSIGTIPLLELSYKVLRPWVSCARQSNGDLRPGQKQPLKMTLRLDPTIEKLTAASHGDKGITLNDRKQNRMDLCMSDL